MEKWLEEAGVEFAIEPKMATSVNPVMAASLLARNTHNRTISKQVVNRFAAAMKRGEWTQNGRTILFSKTGVLLDGQHTLAAIVKSRRTIKLFIGFGFDDAAQETIDAGRKRTLGDLLSLRGTLNSSAVAASLRMAYTMTEVGVPIAPRVTDQSNEGNEKMYATPQQLLKFLENNQDIEDSVSFCNRDVRRVPWLSKSVAGLCHWWFSKYNEEDANVFMDRLLTGTELQRGDPIHKLRERLIKEHTKIVKPRANIKVAFIITAFNQWRSGEGAKTLSFKAGGHTPDKFPKVVIQDGDKIKE